MANGLLHSQDIDFKSCKIVTSAGNPLELKDLVVEFNYYEDIFGNCCSGNLILVTSMIKIILSVLSIIAVSLMPKREQLQEQRPC